jgi:hypothetical protein
MPRCIPGAHAQPERPVAKPIHSTRKELERLKSGTVILLESGFRSTYETDRFVFVSIRYPAVSKRQDLHISLSSGPGIPFAGLAHLALTHPNRRLPLVDSRVNFLSVTDAAPWLRQAHTNCLQVSTFAVVHPSFCALGWPLIQAPGTATDSNTRGSGQECSILTTGAYHSDSALCRSCSNPPLSHCAMCTPDAESGPLKIIQRSAQDSRMEQGICKENWQRTHFCRHATAGK